MNQNQIQQNSEEQNKKTPLWFIIMCIAIMIILLPLILLLIPILIYKIREQQKTEIIEAYLTLGCSKFEEIATFKPEKNYRSLSLKFHPDKNKDDTGKYKILFQSVREARDILNDPENKKIIPNITKKEFDKVKEKFNNGKYQNQNDTTKNIFESLIQKQGIGISKKQEIGISNKILEAPGERTCIENALDQMKMMKRQSEAQHGQQV